VPKRKGSKLPGAPRRYLGKNEKTLDPGKTEKDGKKNLLGCSPSACPLEKGEKGLIQRKKNWGKIAWGKDAVTLEIGRRLENMAEVVDGGGWTEDLEGGVYTEDLGRSLKRRKKRAQKKSGRGRDNLLNIRRCSTASGSQFSEEG